jgi:hypothetical protein
MQLSTHTPPRTTSPVARDRWGALVGGAVVIALVVGLYTTASRYAPPSPGAMPAPAVAARLLPSSLGSLDRAWVVTGDEALRQVRGLHLGTFAMTEAEVAGYGPDATVWVATPARPEAADRYVTRMAEAIADADTPFAPPIPMPDETGVWRTEGTGQDHVFFAADGAIWWLAADAADTEDALSALLREVRP